MTDSELDVLVDAMLPPLRLFCERAIHGLAARLDRLEARAAVPGPPGRDGADGKNGQNADRALIRAMIAGEIAALPPAAPGEPGPPGRDGIDGADGRDGEDADPSEIRVMIAEAVAALPPAAPGEPGPPGRDGIDGRDGKPIEVATVRAMLAEAVAALPTPQDGHSPTEAEILPLVWKTVADALAAVPPAQDGIGLAGAVISREGELVMTMTDGSIRALGPVVGRDVDMAQVERQVAEAMAKIPPPKDGRDGLGLTDLNVVQDGRRIILEFANGETVRKFELTYPVPLYRGVYQDGRSYEHGDQVSYGGSVWIATADTAEKPGEGATAWVLANKRGRDGRDGKDGKPGDRGPEGRPGRIS
jgi:hypothetical protein